MDMVKFHSTWELGVTEDAYADGGSNNVQQWLNLCKPLMDPRGLCGDFMSLDRFLTAPEWPTGYAAESSDNTYCDMPNNENANMDDYLSSRSSSSVDGSDPSSSSKMSKPRLSTNETCLSKTQSTQQPSVVSKRHRRSPKRPADLQETETPKKSKRQRRTVVRDDWDNGRGNKGDNDDDNEDDERLKEEARQNSRRSRIREKNRIAAGKCRSRKRRAISQLTSKHEKLQGLNRQLCGKLADLDAEVYVLKNMLMVHGNSGCESIQQLFKDLAADFILRMHTSTMEHGEDKGRESGQGESASFLAKSIQSVNNVTDLCMD